MQRNYSARDAWKKKEKARNAQNTQNAMNISAGSSWPAQRSAAQQFGRAARAQASSEVHATVSTLSTTHIFAATPLPDAVIPRAGCWTRFWLFMGCAAAQYTDGHY